MRKINTAITIASMPFSTINLLRAVQSGKYAVATLEFLDLTADGIELTTDNQQAQNLIGAYNLLRLTSQMELSFLDLKSQYLNNPIPVRPEVEDILAFKTHCNDLNITHLDFDDQVRVNNLKNYLDNASGASNLVVNNLADLKVWAQNTGLNVSDIEVKGTLDLFNGDIGMSQKALLATNEVVSASTLDGLASYLNLPLTPSPQSLSPYQARVWYSWRKSKISQEVDYSNGLEPAAQEALSMRNTLRTEARNVMVDTDIADFLHANEVNKTWAQALDKYGDDFSEIIQASMRGRGLLNILYKIPD